MQTHLRGRDCITLQEFTKDELDTFLDVAFALKRARALGEPHAYLRDKVLAMLFFFPSTRTRTSFEAGMAQLGGHAQFIESKTTQIAHGDTAKEIGQILGRYNDGIAIRQCDWGTGNKYIRDVAEASRVPVLNMQCDYYHPHQALADIMTIIERFGDPRGKTATVSWARSASYSKPVSVAQSLVLLLPARPTLHSRSSRTSTRASEGPTSSTRRAGVPCSQPRTQKRTSASSTSTSPGSPTSVAWRWLTRTRSTCTRCRPIATSRSPTP
jgi:ornithine carbamoyltransferase